MNRGKGKCPYTQKKTVPINPFMPSGFFYLNSLDLRISNKGGVWLLLLVLCFIEISVLNVNTVGPVAFALGLHCLPMFPL